MALTLYQSPNSVYHYLNGSVYPEWFTATSDNSTLYSDFKYVFKTYAANKITNASELIGNTKNFARINSNLGSFNSVPIVKSLVQSTFDPTITTWTPCTDSIRQYIVKATEYYNGNLQVASEQNYGKNIMIKSNTEYLTYSDYMLNGSTKKFLTDRTGEVDVRLTDYATMRFFNGSCIASSSSQYVSQPYQIEFDFYTGNGQECYKYFWSVVNPYWYTGIALDPDISVFDNHNTKIAPRLIEIPVGPKNFAGLTLNLAWVIGADGTAIPVSPNFPTPASQVFNISTIKYYDVFAYTYPIGAVSKKYRFNIVCENANKPGVQVYWENTKGGVDNFLFSKANTKVNSVSSLDILKNKYQQGHSSTYSGNRNYYIGSTAYDRGSDRVYNEQITTYTLNTDFISQQQANDLESLWSSNNIFCYIESVFYPVISKSESKVIKTTISGLKQYSFEVEISNVKTNS